MNPITPKLTMRKKIKAYMLKNFNTPLELYFLKRPAIRDAEHRALESGYPSHKWKDIYQIVEVEVTEL